MAKKLRGKLHPKETEPSGTEQSCRFDINKNMSLKNYKTGKHFLLGQT